MRYPSLQRRTLALVVVLVTLLALFVYVATRSGPLAPVTVTVAIPAIIIAVAAFVVVLVVRAARKKKAARRGEDKKDE